jgi:hypothetical protein
MGDRHALRCSASLSRRCLRLRGLRGAVLLLLLLLLALATLGRFSSGAASWLALAAGGPLPALRRSGPAAAATFAATRAVFAN